MKLRYFLSGLLGGILVSCGNAPENTELPNSDRISSIPSPTPSSPTELSSNGAQSSSEAALSPQEFCGDPIPDGWERYPFGYYRVALRGVTDISLVKTRICRNAEYSKWIGTSVAFFSSQKQAKNFKNDLINQFGNLELEQRLGRGSEVSKISLMDAIEVQEAGEFCSLGATKIGSQELFQKTKIPQRSIDDLYQLKNSNQKQLNLKIILATYIPSSFSVTSVSIRDQPDARFAQTSYEIKYENRSGEKIVTEVYHGPLGGAPSDIDTVKLKLIPFGETQLYITGEEGSLKKTVSFFLQDRSDYQVYRFSMVSSNSQENLKVLNSLQCFDLQKN